MNAGDNGQNTHSAEALASIKAVSGSLAELNKVTKPESRAARHLDLPVEHRAKSELSRQKLLDECAAPDEQVLSQLAADELVLAGLLQDAQQQLALRVLHLGDNPKLALTLAKTLREVSQVSSAVSRRVRETLLAASLDPTQKTTNQSVTIHYRFHPLHGQTFRPLRCFGGPPPVVEIQPAGGRKVFVPTWMTEPAAQALPLRAQPQIRVKHLLDVAALVAAALAELEPSDTLGAGEDVAGQEAPHGSSTATAAHPCSGRKATSSIPAKDCTATPRSHSRPAASGGGHGAKRGRSRSKRRPQRGER